MSSEAGDILTHTVRSDEAGDRVDVLIATSGLLPSRAVAQKLIGRVNWWRKHLQSHGADVDQYVMSVSPFAAIMNGPE